MEVMRRSRIAARRGMCPCLAGAPHAVAERASAPLAPSTRSPTACGVPAERDPIGEHAVPTPRVELTRAHRALLPRSLPAPQAQVPAAHLRRALVELIDAEAPTFGPRIRLASFEILDLRASR